MTPRRPLRSALAATAVSLLLLTGCSPDGTSAGAPAPTRASTSAAGTAASTPTPAPTVEGDPAVVVRVIDGDTVDVRKDGEDAATRVRLLNIDTPETKHPSKPVQCLGPEATEHLEGLLQAGDRVTLQYDRERTDKYGRTLAGVFEGTTLVNAEIARAGLGVPVVFEPNRRFYPEVLAAWKEAQRSQAGLNQPDLACALPVVAGAQSLDQPVPDTLAEELALAYAAATSGDQEWMQVLYRGDLPRVKKLVERHAAAESEASQAAQAEREAAERSRREAVEVERAEQERRAAAEAEQAEQERRAAEEAEEAARAEQEEAAAREEAAAETEEAPDAAESESRGFADTTGGEDSADEEDAAAESSGSSSGGTSQKAPNRCYAPGGETYEYCDDEGTSSGSSAGDIAEEDTSSEASGGGDGGPVAGSGGECPPGYPVKVSSSGKYHVPGGQYYEVTGSKNCFASAAAAEAAGYVASKL